MVDKFLETVEGEGFLVEYLPWESSFTKASICLRLTCV